MKTIASVSILLIGSLPACAQEAAPGTSLPKALFQLREIDMHLHSGMERPLDLDSWLNLAAEDGRKVVVLIDHLELYRKTSEAYELWRDKGKFEARYPVGAPGHRALMDDFSRIAAKRHDLIIFRAWEVGENELDTGLEMAPMEMAELIGFHIGPNNGGAPPDGRHLIQRARQALELQHRLPVPMVLLHPFPMRVENVVNRALKEGRQVKDISAAEFRFFQPGEQEELARVLKGSSVYVEIGRATSGCFKIPACREAMISDIRPLAAAGVQFTVSTDTHTVDAAKLPFDPQAYCDALGVTPANTNPIIRELLALRAKHALLKR